MKTKIRCPYFSWKKLFIAISLMIKFSQVWATNENVMGKLIGMSIEELMEIPVVTIATGTQQTTTQAAAVATVITAEDIKAMGSNELSEILQKEYRLQALRA